MRLRRRLLDRRSRQVWVDRQVQSPALNPTLEKMLDGVEADRAELEGLLRIPTIARMYSDLIARRGSP